ncbi:MAG: thermonuclease family protein [Nitrospirota bacterium]
MSIVHKLNLVMRRKTAKILSAVFIILVSLFYILRNEFSLPFQQGSESLFFVTEINDGDTISVIMNKKREKVRLIGIDAPEIGQKPWGRRSKKFLKDLVSSSGWKVRVELDIQPRDKYGRMLAYVWTKDGRLVNLLMLKNGYAMLFTVPPNVKYVSEFREAQREAREKKRGIWSKNGLRERPRDYRREHPVFR